MNFGDAWKDYLGECNKQTAFEMLDFFYENGGNFIDTANNYQAEESETWIGEWMKAKNNRDEMVIATKFTTGFRTGSEATEKIKSNFQGNHSKSLRVSLNASLRKLQTDYVVSSTCFPAAADYDLTPSLPSIGSPLCPLVGLHHQHRRAHE